MPHACYMRTSQTPRLCIPFAFVLRNVWEGQGETDTCPFDTAPGNQPVREEKQLLLPGMDHPVAAGVYQKEP